MGELSYHSSFEGRFSSRPTLKGSNWRRAIPRKPNKRRIKRALRIQYAALPYRLLNGAALEFLVVTTRQSKRWIVPKGWPIKGLKPSQSAAREAFEEAGVRGKAGSKAIGQYVYEKALDDIGITVACEVKVFPLLVKRQAAAWPESAERVIQWVDSATAEALVSDEGLKTIIGAFAKRAAPSAAKSKA